MKDFTDLPEYIEAMRNRDWQQCDIIAEEFMKTNEEKWHKEALISAETWHKTYGWTATERSVIPCLDIYVDACRKREEEIDKLKSLLDECLDRLSQYNTQVDFYEDTKKLVEDL